MASRGGLTVKESAAGSMNCQLCPSLFARWYCAELTAVYGFTAEAVPALGAEHGGGDDDPDTYATNRLPAATTNMPSPAAMPAVGGPLLCSSGELIGVPTF